MTEPLRPDEVEALLPPDLYALRYELRVTLARAQAMREAFGRASAAAAAGFTRFWAAIPEDVRRQIEEDA